MSISVSSYVADAVDTPSTSITLTPAAGASVGDLILVVLTAFQTLNVGQLDTSVLPYWSWSQGGNSIYLRKVATIGDIGNPVTFSFPIALDLSGSMITLRSSTSGYVPQFLSAWDGQEARQFTGTPSALLTVAANIGVAPTPPPSNINGDTWTHIFTMGTPVDTSTPVQSWYLDAAPSTNPYYAQWPGGVGAVRMILGFVFSELPPNPFAPTLRTPAPPSTVDATEAFPYCSVYNPSNGQPANAAKLTVSILPGPGTIYWDGTAWVGGDTWFPVTVGADERFCVSPAAGLYAGPVNGFTYSYSMAFQEASTDAQGPLAASRAFNTNLTPIVSVVAPSADQIIPNPIVNFIPTFYGGTHQLEYGLIVYNQAQYTAGGFVPNGGGPAVYNNGGVFGAETSVTIPQPLSTDTYRAYISVIGSDGLQSLWEYSEFTVTIEVPAAPLLQVFPANDGTTGAPEVSYFLAGQDNLLSADNAGVNGVSGDAVSSLAGSTWAGTNCDLTLSDAEVLEGTTSMLVTPTGAGSTTFETAAQAYVGDNLSVTIGLYGAGYTGAADLSITFSDSTVVTVGVTITSGWNVFTIEDATPVGAATTFFIEVAYTAAGTGSTLYMDEAGVFGGSTAPAWSAGGFTDTAVGVLQFSLDGVNFTDCYTLGDIVLGGPYPPEETFGFDVFAPPNTALYYRAAISSQLVVGGLPYTFTSAWSEIAGPVITDPLAMWWLLMPPTGTTTMWGPAIGFNLSGPIRRPTIEQGTINYPLGRPHGVKVTDGTKGQGGALAIREDSITGPNGLAALRQVLAANSSGYLYVMDPTGLCQFITGDPATNFEEDFNYMTALTPNPQSDTTFAYIEVDNPFTVAVPVQTL
jgi:hypothetical protein